MTFLEWLNQGKVSLAEWIKTVDIAHPAQGDPNEWLLMAFIVFAVVLQIAGFTIIWRQFRKPKAPPEHPLDVLEPQMIDLSDFRDRP